MVLESQLFFCCFLLSGIHLGFASLIPHGELIHFFARCVQFTLTCRGSAGHIGTSLSRLGFSVSVFYLFAAVFAWQLGSLSTEALAAMGGTA
jgi:hypothetical protein